jgi:hypothetical protein
MASALLGFCAVTLAHTACIVAYRVMRVLRGFPVTGFSKSRAEGENSLYGRICASHANCLENLPCVEAPFLPLDRISDTFCSVFATLVLTNKASAHIHSHCHTVTHMLCYSQLTPLSWQVFGGPNVTALADYILMFRLGQALVHCASVSAVAVNARFAFFAAQLFCMTQIGVQTYAAQQASA